MTCNELDCATIVFIGVSEYKGCWLVFLEGLYVHKIWPLNVM